MFHLFTNIYNKLLLCSKYFLLLVTLSGYAHAGDGRLDILLSGTSYHFNKDGDHNEDNYGVGISYFLSEDNPLKDFDLLRDKPIYFELDVFKDSFSDISFSAGLAYKRKVFNHLNIGLKAGLMKSKYLYEDHGLYINPYLVPLVETAFDFPLNLRMMAIPPLGDITEGYLMFQLVLDY